MKPQYALELKTTKSSAIKTLIENLQSLLTEVNFVFTPTTVDKDGNEKQGGLMIKEINKYNSLLVFVKLDAKNFESYSYNHSAEQLTVGINLSYMTRCLKCMANYDSLTMAIDKEDMNHLILTLENNKDKKNIKLIIKDLNCKQFKIDPVVFPYMATLSSNDFHKYCKDLSIVSDVMDIKCNGKKLFFSGKGEIGEVDYEILPSVNGLTITVNTEKDIIVQGLFDIKYLTIFSKCSTFDEEVEIYLENDYPIIVRYKVSSLGEIKFVLSQKKAKDDYDLY
jgi:proliferating cell nuclear antigen